MHASIYSVVIAGEKYSLQVQSRAVPGQVYWPVDWTVLPAYPHTLRPPPAVRTPVVVRLFLER